MNFIINIFKTASLSSKKSFVLIFSTLFVSLLDVLGLGLFFGLLNVLFSDSDNVIIDYLFVFDFINQNNVDFYAIVFFAIIFSIRSITILSLHLYIIKLSKTIQKELRNYVAKYYINGKFNKYFNNNFEELSNDFTINVNKFSNHLFQPLLMMISDVMIVSFIVILLVLQNLILFLVLFSVLAIFGSLFIIYIRPIQKRSGHLHLESSKKILMFANELYFGAKQILIFNKTQLFLKRISKASDGIISSEIKNQFFSKLPRYSLEIIIVLLISVFLIFSIDIENRNELFLDVSLFMIAFMRLAPSLTSFFQNFGKVEFGRDANEVISNIKNNVDKNKKLSKTLNSPISFEKVVIDSLNFSYDKKNEIFNNLSFTINKGDKVAIVGPSGSGKSTLISLLLGFIESEDILIDNIQLKKINQKWLNSLAYISQSSFILSTSIKNNITLLEENADPELLESALTLSNLKDFYKNRLNEKNISTNLSGGEAQRIEIARAVYSNRKILFLDEVTSALDNKNEKEIFNLVTSFPKEYTIFMITHSEKYLSHFDKIIKI